MRYRIYVYVCGTAVLGCSMMIAAMSDTPWTMAIAFMGAIGWAFAAVESLPAEEKTP